MASMWHQTDEPSHLQELSNHVSVVSYNTVSGANIVAQRIKLPPAVPVSSMASVSGPSYSNSDSASCECTWESNRGWPKGLGLCNHVQT